MESFFEFNKLFDSSPDFIGELALVFIRRTAFIAHPLLVVEKAAHTASTDHLFTQAAVSAKDQVAGGTLAHKRIVDNVTGLQQSDRFMPSSRRLGCVAFERLTTVVVVVRIELAQVAFEDFLCSL